MKADFVPWFGDQLFAGNSLIGARAEVYPINALEQSTKKEDRWYNHGPRAVTKDEPRKDNEIYHFLLPDPGMSDYDDKVVKPYMPEESERINEWRREFTKPLNTDEIRQLKDLSSAVDKLFEENVKNLAEERRENNDPIEIFGRPASKTEGTDYTEKNQKLAKTRGDEEKNSPAYLRLKTAMNYWCALWFWPLKDTEMLPSRSEFIMDMSLILEGNVFSTTFDFSDQESVNDEQKEIYVGLLNEIETVGKIDVNELNQKIPRLGVVSEITDTNRFFHWPVEFGDILITKGGFDLVVGNPPWIRPEWHDNDYLSSYFPKIVVSSYSATQVNEVKNSILNGEIKRLTYIYQFNLFFSMNKFINAAQNYPLIDGSNNLYKCFIEKSFKLVKFSGISGLLHPTSHMNDQNGKNFRQVVYQRLVIYFQFTNEMKSALFADIHSYVNFSINIYEGKSSDIGFQNINNLYLPSTIYECYLHDGSGPISGKKDEFGNLEVGGHRKRIIEVNDETISMFTSIMESDNFSNNLATRFPSPHSVQDIQVLDKIVKSNVKFGSTGIIFYMTTMWNETTAIKKDKIIKRETTFQQDPEMMIISGPNFYVCNPLAKTPRAKIRVNSDYDVIDLTYCNDDYLPRCNFLPVVDKRDYISRIQTVDWNGLRHTEFFRGIFRARVNPSNERTIICSILIPGIAHTHSTESVSFQNEFDLINAVGLLSSLPLDFVAKTAGYVAIPESTLITLPWTSLPSTALHRTLQLSCLTTWYAPLWDRCAYKFDVEDWSDDRLSLSTEGPNFATKNWTRACGIRTDFARRQALLEIDVIASISLGLDLKDLLYMYDIHFPIMKKYDKETYFDQYGRIVFTNSQNLVGVGFDRSEWEKYKDLKKVR